MGNYTVTQTLQATAPQAKRLRPLLKWAGGKSQELKYILPNLPKKFENYYEPFVGGGAVYTAVQAEKYFINDKSTELISLYRVLNSRRRGAFFSLLSDLLNNWNNVGWFFLEHEEKLRSWYLDFSTEKISQEALESRVRSFIQQNSMALMRLFVDGFEPQSELFLAEVEKNIIRKYKRMKKLEAQKGKLPDTDLSANIETALRSAFYMQMRRLYNMPKKEMPPVLASVIFLFIRNFAYSGMFRYNSKGEFNVPYGGIAYNRKDFKKQVNYLQCADVHDLLKRTKIESADFQKFLNKYPPTENDFVFLDPPYDSEFSTYAKNAFGREDQQRLADYFIKHCPAKWMMVIKKTDFIADLYFDKGLNISAFDKKYLVSFMNRNDKDVQHLMIRNY